MQGSIIILTLWLGVSAALFLPNATNWDALRVKFAANPFSSYSFAYMPLTVAEATEQGFYPLSSECDEQNSWRGARYIKDSDLALILLFDIKGYIAGIQTSIQRNQSNGYPTKALQPPFIAEGERFLLTAYFQEPSKICTEGRSDSLVKDGIIGSNLYIQNSTRPEDSILIPRKQADLAANKNWTEGNCFAGMGKHYWYNLSEDMDCGTVFPYFLLFNQGELVGIGWALTTYIASSDRYEHPPQDSYKWFMKVPPKCLATAGEMTTMHIYLNSNILLNNCMF